MNLIGLDSALAHTGWCVLEDETLIEYGVINTQPTQSDFERVQLLHDALGKLCFDWGAFSPHGNCAQVIIEKTDWTRGKGNSRADWIVEAGAREALAIGVTTAFGICIEHGITPIVLGPNEWHRALGVHRKEAVAAYVAAVFADRFQIICKESQRKSRRSFARVVIDRATGKQVPDAIAMTLVAYRRLHSDSRIQRQGETR